MESLPPPPPDDGRSAGAVPPPPAHTVVAVSPSDEPRRRGRVAGLAFAGLLLAVGGGVVGAFTAEQFDDDTPARSGIERVESDDEPEAGDTVDDSATDDLEGLDVAPASDTSGSIDVLAVAEAVAPTVVTISADIEGGDAVLGSGTSVGTGVIITDDGQVLTNAHVVDGATEIRVRLSGETEPITATLLAANAINDLALLQLEGDGYPPATFADPDSIELGDQVVAIGFALDLDGDPSVTLGIVSALDRTLNMGNSEVLDGLIQTDAAISSGNSGGPLVNNQGQVVGINTAVARGDVFTAATNVGFAISVDEIAEVLPKLRDAADGVEQAEGYLGVTLQQRIDGGQGALISEVSDGTPAADAGLQTDDLVIAVDGSAIDGADGLIAATRDREPGDVVTITVVRDGDELDVDVTLADRAELLEEPVAPDESDESGD